jgi:hypothetical protein
MWRQGFREWCGLPKTSAPRGVELLLQPLVLPAQPVAFTFDPLQLSLQPFDLTTVPFQLLRRILLGPRGIVDHALVMPELWEKYKERV